METEVCSDLLLAGADGENLGQMLVIMFVCTFSNAISRRTISNPWKRRVLVMQKRVSPMLLTLIKYRQK